MPDAVAILDFGSQYTQLIARRIREMQVYCEIFPWDAPEAQIKQLNPKAFILSGGPASVYEENAPVLQDFVIQSGSPILGICYGMHILAHHLGGQVTSSDAREYGLAEVETIGDDALFPASSMTVWMSHGDRTERLPKGFVSLATSGNSPICAMADAARRYYAVQFHPEVRHTKLGKQLLENFIFKISGLKAEWTAENIIEQAVEAIRKQVGDHRVISAVSGGVDSSVATALVHRAIGDQLSAVFVDTGMLRKNEVQQVETAFAKHIGLKLVTVHASDDYFTALHGVTEPEQKRKIIGGMFIHFFEEKAQRMGNPEFLVQGTIYPDVVESSAPDRNKAARIKTHHNVGGLPEKMRFKLVEPLRYLFKDEVRQIGEGLGLPSELVWRQPFPGPGLAVRCLGEVTPKRIDTLQNADDIFISELIAEGLINKKTTGEATLISQAFAVLLPVKTVGVMGDQRTYQEVIALRAVTTEDFMTADWALIPPQVLSRVANRIVNEVKGVNRVVYDITSKPPATIEWE
ncbi:MAG: glutamine-hydrolyzing GMP synthase [Anaerolineaceae bacterium]